MAWVAYSHWHPRIYILILFEQCSGVCSFVCGSMELVWKPIHLKIDHLVKYLDPLWTYAIFPSLE